MPILSIGDPVRSWDLSTLNASAGGLNLTLTGSLNFKVASSHNSDLALDAVNLANVLECNASASNYLASAADADFPASYTLEQWISFDALGASRGGFSKRATADGLSTQAAIVLFGDAIRAMRTYNVSGVPNNNGYLSSGVTPATNQWYHVVVTWDDATRTLSIHVRADDAASWTSATSVQNGASQPWSTNAELASLATPAYFGVILPGFNPHDGLLGRTRVYAGVATESDRNILFNAGRGMLHANLVGSREMDAGGPVWNGQAMLPVFASLDNDLGRVLFLVLTDSNWTYAYAMRVLLTTTLEYECFATSILAPGGGTDTDDTNSNVSNRLPDESSWAFFTCETEELAADFPNSIYPPSNLQAARLRPAVSLPLYLGADDYGATFVTSDLAGVDFEEVSPSGLGLSIDSTHPIGVNNQLIVYCWTEDLGGSMAWSINRQNSPYTELAQDELGGHGVEGIPYLNTLNVAAATRNYPLEIRLGRDLSTSIHETPLSILGCCITRPITHGVCVSVLVSEGGVGIYENLNDVINGSATWVYSRLHIWNDMVASTGIAVLYVKSGMNDPNDTFAAHGSSANASTATGQAAMIEAARQKLMAGMAAAGFSYKIIIVWMHGHRGTSAALDVPFDTLRNDGVTHCGQYALSTRGQPVEVVYVDTSHTRHTPPSLAASTFNGVDFAHPTQTTLNAEAARTWELLREAAFADDSQRNRNRRGLNR